MREMSPEGEEVIRVGKLYLVDLAGSENVNRQAPHSKAAAILAEQGPQLPHRTATRANQ